MLLKSWKVTCISTGHRGTNCSQLHNMKLLRNLAYCALPLTLALGASAQPGTTTMVPASNVMAMSADDQLAMALKRGATIEEIAAMTKPAVQTPMEALRTLKQGNARFYGGMTGNTNFSVNERRAQVLGQSPFATILGCSDSRVPTEILFDQKPGSLFIARVAGNIASPDTLGSIDYSIEKLGTPLIVVMGHEECGAVKAAMLPASDIAKESKYIQYLVSRIQPAVADLPMVRDSKAKVREAVVSNVRLQTYLVSQDPVVANALRSNKVGVVGAYYEIGSGAVDFFTDQKDLMLTPAEMTRARTLMSRNNGDAKVALAQLQRQAHEGHDHS